ncbi:podocalyxin isoform X2 [Anarhichas minor]|uniref:podocalyxin isoform X2 n=1 Tax=Anarhichas minor TaxID=65739 RepID=UPI003F73A925
MRATMRITWPLLSLSFLFLSVCSKADSESTTSVTSARPTSGSKNVTVTALISTRPAAVVTTPAMTATSKPTDKPTSAGQQTPTVTNNTLAPPMSSGPPTTMRIATAAATVTPAPSSPKNVVPTTIADSSSVSAVTTKATTMQTPEASAPGNTSGTGVPTTGLPGNVGTIEITKVLTVAPTSGQQSVTHTIIATKTSQDSKGGEKTTVAVTGHEQTVARATELTGNTVTTSTPSPLAKAGSPAPQTIGTKAGTTSPQTSTATTPIPTATTTIPTTSSTSSTTSTTSSTAAAQPKTFLYSLNNGHGKEEEKDLVELCRRLMVNLQDGNCTLTWQHHNGKIQVDCVEINGQVKTSTMKKIYEEITKKPTDSKTLIAILASSGALLIMIVILAVCASHHRKPYNENQHLTEELHTVENGYHDNPTLEVMEVQPEMQEKKVALNGEFNDSWIVPIDNLLKEDIVDEEDTHL